MSLCSLAHGGVDAAAADASAAARRPPVVVLARTQRGDPMSPSMLLLPLPWHSNPLLLCPVLRSTATLYCRAHWCTAAPMPLHGGADTAAASVVAQQPFIVVAGAAPGDY